MDPTTPLDLSPYKTRQMEVNGVTYTLMTNVGREKAGWRVTVERTGEKRSKKFFADSQFKGTRLALDAAHRWLIGLQVRRPYEGIDLTREPARKLELRRHVIDGENPEYGFVLRIAASKSVEQRDWMTEPLGPGSQLSQAKLKIAIARLHGRWFEYRRRKVAMSNEEALDADYSRVTPAQQNEHNTRLLVGDIRKWTGVGRGVTFMGTKPRPGAPDVAVPEKALVMRGRKQRAKAADAPH